MPYIATRNWIMSGFKRKSSKFLRAISAVIKNPLLLNAVLDQEDEHRDFMLQIKELDNGFPEIDFNDLLEDEILVKPFAFLDGGSLPTDLALLKLLAKKFKAKNYFEIGTWRGESVSNVADVVEECYSLNLSDEEIKSRGMSDEYIGLHRHFSKNNPRITHLFGDSRSFDFSEYEGKFDLVFVDGDHHFDSVVHDTQTAFKLISDKGIIVWHDYSNSPESTRWNVAHAIWKGCPTDKRKHLRAVSHTLCAVFLPHKMNSKTRKYPKNPESGFEIRIKKPSS